jgi:hypothetical protein
MCWPEAIYYTECGCIKLNVIPCGFAESPAKIAECQVFCHPSGPLRSMEPGWTLKLSKNDERHNCGEAEALRCTATYSRLGTTSTVMYKFACSITRFRQLDYLNSGVVKDRYQDFRHITSIQERCIQLLAQEIKERDPEFSEELRRLEQETTETARCQGIELRCGCCMSFMTAGMNWFQPAFVPYVPSIPTCSPCCRHPGCQVPRVPTLAPIRIQQPQPLQQARQDSGAGSATASDDAQSPAPDSQAQTDLIPWPIDLSNPAANNFESDLSDYMNVLAPGPYDGEVVGIGPGLQLEFVEVDAF